MTATRRHIICITLRALGERLPFGHFQRVHRSYIVNTQRIDAVEDHLLHLGPYKVPVGKSRTRTHFTAACAACMAPAR